MRAWACVQDAARRPADAGIVGHLASLVEELVRAHICPSKRSADQEEHDGPHAHTPTLNAEAKEAVSAQSAVTSSQAAAWVPILALLPDHRFTTPPQARTRTLTHEHTRTRTLAEQTPHPDDLSHPMERVVSTTAHGGPTTIAVRTTIPSCRAYSGRPWSKLLGAGIRSGRVPRLLGIVAMPLVGRHHQLLRLQAFDFAKGARHRDCH